MRIDLTIDDDGTSRDVAVLAPCPLPLHNVQARVVTATGVADGDWWAGQQRLDPDATLGRAGLRTGTRIEVGRPRSTGPAAGVLTLQVVGGPDAGQVLPLERGRLIVGRDAACDLVLSGDRTSRRHAQVDVHGNRIELTDLASTNGTSVDDHRLGAAPVRVRPGALIKLGDALLSVSGPDQVPAAVTEAGDGALLVNRAPRLPGAVGDATIDSPQNERAGLARPVQWISALAPAAAGGALAWWAHSPEFLLFALLSPIMLLSTSLGDRLHWRRSRRRTAIEHARASAVASEQIVAGLAAEAIARRAAAPDPAAVLRIVSAPGNRLWERRTGDADALCVRIATADLPSALRHRTGSSSAPAGIVPSVPVGIDLRAGPLGISGPPRVAGGVARWLVAQLAAAHSPEELEIALLLGADGTSWRWARWLPHVRARAPRVATTPAAAADLVAELTARRQRPRDGTRTSGAWAGRWTALVVDDAAAASDVAGLAALLTEGPAHGITAICVDVEESALPAACVAVARVSDDTGARLSVRGAVRVDDALADQVSPSWAEQVARALAPLTDAAGSVTSGLPDNCRLLDVLGVTDLEPSTLAQRWAAGAGRVDTVLGMGADGPLVVDLAAEGPHMLIAGTTGAGKSELLQTLVAGLALSHAPHELTFLLIDYKGGAAFADCARLPHTGGLVTDLDAHLTERALRSLDAELRRRERLLATVGAPDLEAYRRGGPRERLARLVIVVDEFAALAQELPEFLRGLVGVAQRGRSLGVHLVLATQRPGSALSAEIRANTSLRIALRVTDPGESTDVLDAPDAATIDRATPGRGYLRSGPLLVPFQTARVSGNASRASTVRVVALGPWRELPAEPPEPGADDLARVVDALIRAAEQAGEPPARSPWLAALPTAFPLTAVAGERLGSVVFGLVDLPARQQRSPLSLDLTPAGSLLVAGRPRSGRTSAAIAVALAAARGYGPDRLELYVIDATGDLLRTVGALPHLATGLGPDDDATVPTLLRRLGRRRGASGTAGLLVVDGWDVFLGRHDDGEAVRCTDLLTGLLRTGSITGLTVLVTGDRSVLTPRFAGSFAERLALRLADAADYGVLGIAAREVPAHQPPGRGLRASDHAEIQLAHAGEAPDLAAAARSASECARDRAGVAPAPAAVRLRPLPTVVRLRDLPPTDPAALRIGRGGDDAGVLTLDPFVGGRRLLVAGPPRSGRSTLLVTLLHEARAADVRTVVVATSRSPLSAAASQAGAPAIGVDGDLPVLEPDRPTLVLLDDSEAFADSRVEAGLQRWLRAGQLPVAIALAGRCDDLATAYRGLAADVRRNHCGVLLRPGPVDGELVGVRLPRRFDPGPPGRGVVVGEPGWGPAFADGEALPVQVAQP